MNKVILSGRPIADPEIRQAGETTIARYTLAVDRTKKQDNQPNADFIACTCFGKIAEFAEKYVHKGVKIIVTGHWQTGSYTNKDGNKVYTNDCLVESHEFCEKANSSNKDSAPKNSSSDGFMNIPDGIGEELPFN